MKYEKIIFVSNDGTYRAPMAASIMKKRISNVKIEARGLVVLFPEPINPKGITIALSRGYKLRDKESKKLSKEDFYIDTLILVMTEKLKKQVYDKFKNALNVYTLKEFADGQGDIENSFGKSLDEYVENFEQIEEWVNKATDKLMA